MFFVLVSVVGFGQSVGLTSTASAEVPFDPATVAIPGVVKARTKPCFSW